MAQLPDLGFTIRAKDEASPVLKRVDESAKSLTGSFSALNPATIGVSAAIAAMTVVASKAVKEFLDADLATKKLNDALKGAGVFSEAYANHLTDVANELQKTTRFSDDQVKSVQQLFVTFGVFGTTLDKATQAALDLSTVMGGDVNGAAQALLKAVEGNTRGLKSYGVVVDESVPKYKRFEEALKQIQERMGGRAQGAADTVIGSFDQLKNRISDVLEEIGKLILSMPGLKSGLDLAAKAATSLRIALGGGTERENLQREYDALVVLLGKAQAGIRDLSQGGTRFKSADEIEKRLDDITKRLREMSSLDKTAVLDAQKKTDQLVQHKQLLEDQKNALKEAEKAAKDALENERKRNRLEAERLKYIEGVAERYQQINQRNDVGDINTTSSAIGSFASGNITGLISQGVTGAAGLAGLGALAGPMGAMATGIIELVMNAKELPEKIGKFIEGLAEGLVEGLPALMDYLAGPFIEDLMTKLIPALVEWWARSIPLLTEAFITAVGVLIRNLPNMFVGMAKGIGSGIWEGIKGIGSSIGGFFGFGGGGPSREERFLQSIENLSSVLKDMNTSLRATYQTIQSQFQTPRQRESALGRDYASDASRRADLIAQLEEAMYKGKKGYEEQVEILQQLEALQQQMIGTAQERYNVEMKRLDEVFNAKKKIYDEERNAILQNIAALEGFKKTSLDAFRSARESILSSSLGTSGNLDRLRDAFNTAQSPEARAGAAQAYAGGIQAQFQAYQALASSGAITGEEFKRVQADLLAELADAENSTISEFDRLISVQQQQLSVLDRGFAKLSASIDRQREEAKQLLLEIAKGLSKLPQGNKSGGLTYSEPSFNRDISENRGNIAGRIRSIGGGGRIGRIR